MWTLAYNWFYMAGMKSTNRDIDSDSDILNIEDPEYCPPLLNNASQTQQSSDEYYKEEMVIVSNRMSCKDIATSQLSSWPGHLGLVLSPQ